MFKTVKWKSNKDIQKAFTKSGYAKLQELAKKADYVEFVYSLFGVSDKTYSFLTDYDKERLNKIARDLKESSQYYHKIRNARH